MIIRKLYRFESAHIVRKCSSERCSSAIHGHSNIVEVFIESKHLDDGMMVYDFGLLGEVKEIIDSFDHSYIMWNEESEEFQNFIKQFSARWISLPISPTAEGFSLVFFKLITQILANTKFLNGEKCVRLKSVRVHETATGYAECFNKDYNIFPINIDDIIFSEAVMDDWKIKVSDEDD